MKRIVLWLLSTLSVVVLMLGYHTSTSSTLPTSSPTSIVSDAKPPTSTSGSGTTSSSRSHSSGSTSGSSSGSSSGGTSGTSTHTSTVTGSVASTEWGPVQVQLTLKGGTITRVKVLQYPSGEPRDAEINSYALPILMQETIHRQSAQIDMVSGATVTSTGYEQSLQSALDRAGA
jgi:hypothetical protein